MSEDRYRYTYQYDWMSCPSEEDCTIRKDLFHPYGDVKEGLKLRGEFGFMEIVKVFEEPSLRFGKFIAKSIPYSEMNTH